jgi:cell shape-determining protein MreD
MGYYLAFPILIVAVVLQSSFFPLFFEGTAQPELMLLIVIAWSIHVDWHEAIFWVFLGGIMQDLMAFTPTGTSVIVPLIVVFVINWLESRLYQFSDSPHRSARGSCLQTIIDGIRNSLSVIILLIGFTVLATISNHIVIVFVLGMGNYTTNITAMVQMFTLPTLLYNLILVLPVYFGLRRIQKRIPRPQSAWGVSSQA